MAPGGGGQGGGVARCVIGWEEESLDGGLIRGGCPCGEQDACGCLRRGGKVGKLHVVASAGRQADRIAPLCMGMRVCGVCVLAGGMCMLPANTPAVRVAGMVREEQA